MAKTRNAELFEESSQGAVGAITALVFIVSCVLAFGGIILMGYGFNVEIGSTAELLVFAGGLVASVIGFMIPFTVLPALGK